MDNSLDSIERLDSPEILVSRQQRSVADDTLNVAAPQGRLALRAIACVVYCGAIIIFGPPASTGNILGILMPDFIFAPAIVTLLVLVSCGNIWLTRLMSSGPMVVAGTISYSVYLLQTLAFRAVEGTFVDLHFFGNIMRAISGVLV